MAGTRLIWTTILGFWMAGLDLDSMKFSWFTDNGTVVVVGLACGAWQYSAKIQELSCFRRHFCGLDISLRSWVDRMAGHLRYLATGKAIYDAIFGRSQSLLPNDCSQVGVGKCLHSSHRSQDVQHLVWKCPRIF